MSVIIKSNKSLNRIPNFILDINDGLALDFSKGIYKNNGTDVALKDVIEATVAGGSTIIGSFKDVGAVPANTPRISYNAAGTHRGLLVESSTPVNLLKSSLADGKVPNNFKVEINFGDNLTYYKKTFCLRILGKGSLKVTIPDINVSAEVTQGKPLKIEPSKAGTFMASFEKVGDVEYAHLDDISYVFSPQIRKNLSDSVISEDVVEIKPNLVPSNNFTLICEYVTPTRFVSRGTEQNLGVFGFKADNGDFYEGSNIAKNPALVTINLNGLRSYNSSTVIPLSPNGMKRVAIKVDGNTITYFKNGVLIGTSERSVPLNIESIMIGGTGGGTLPDNAIITQMIVKRSLVSSESLKALTAI